MDEQEQGDSAREGSARAKVLLAKVRVVVGGASSLQSFLYNLKKNTRHATSVFVIILRYYVT